MGLDVTCHETSVAGSNDPREARSGKHLKSGLGVALVVDRHRRFRELIEAVHSGGKQYREMANQLGKRHKDLVLLCLMPRIERIRGGIAFAIGFLATVRFG
jgi:hypothetical protein